MITGLNRDSNFAALRLLRWLLWAGQLTCWLFLAFFGYKSEGNAWAHVEIIGGLTFILLQIALYLCGGTSSRNSTGD